MKIGGSVKTFTADVYYGNKLDSYKTVRWWATDLFGNTTNMITITDKGNNVCSVLAVDDENNIGESILLKVALSDDSTVTNEVELYLDGLY